jgi:hypothetical protein
MTAPERIWAWETLNCNGQWTIAEGDGIEYIRADLADTATWNAAIKVAAGVVSDHHDAFYRILSLLKVRK